MSIKHAFSHALVKVDKFANYMSMWWIPQYYYYVTETLQVESFKKIK